MTQFDDVEAAVDAIEGWLRRAQARRLWDLARNVGDGGSIVEIGSFRGKSTVVLARASAPSVRVYAIDPHAGTDRDPGVWTGTADDGRADHAAFVANLEANGVTDRVIHVREFSQDAQDLVAGAIDFLYVDGAHGYDPALSDIEEWGERVAPGGSMAIHDVYTSLFVSLAVMRALWFSSEWTYVGKVRSLAVYRREPVRGLARLTNPARQAGNVPWFVKNLVTRGLGAAGLHRVARLGHAPGGGVY